MVLQTAECLTGDAEPKASPCCAITGETTRTANLVQRRLVLLAVQQWQLVLRYPAHHLVQRSCQGKLQVLCCGAPPAGPPTTSRRNLKQQFFERAVRFIRCWLGIDCRDDVSFLWILLLMLQRQESQKRRQNRFLVHHQEIHHQAHAERMSPPFLTQDSSDFCSDYFRNANWTGILKQGTWMPMSDEACGDKTGDESLSSLNK